MKTHELEDQIRNVLERQATRLDVPNLRSEDLLSKRVRRGFNDDRHTKSAWRMVGIATAVVVLIVGIVSMQLRQDTTKLTAKGTQTTEPTTPLPRHSFSTPTVRMSADLFEIETLGKKFSPPIGAVAHSNPGSWNSYTPVEITWQEHGVKMTAQIQFRSDGVEWWADDILVYTGPKEDDFVRAPGEYFRSPLGTPFKGDLELPHIQMRGLSVEPFIKPDACINPTRPRALIPGFDVIKGSSGGGFGMVVTFVDTSTCLPISTVGYRFEFTTLDPSVAATSDYEFPYDITLGYGLTAFDMISAGTTTLKIAVIEEKTGEVVDQAEIPVDVEDGFPTEATVKP